MKELLINIFVFFLLTNFTLAQTEIAKLTANDGITDDEFGVSVSLSGDCILIGASGVDGGKGSAYIFKRDGDTWTELVKLTGSDCDTGTYFGLSVSLSGNNALVGAFLDKDLKGSAYIFKHDGDAWTEQVKLTGSDCDTNAMFGFSVSLAGDYALVGAPGDNGEKGLAYIFKHDGNTWTEQSILTGSECDTGAKFGYSVYLSGEYALIGAPWNEGAKGSAYIFKRDGNTWTEQVKLTGSDCDINAYFGYSVSLSGDYGLVGAILDEDLKGSAYTFKHYGDTWTEQTKLTGSDCDTGDGFGYSVSLSGDYALVGAFFFLDVDQKGSAFIFKRDGDTWTEKTKLTGSHCDTGAGFGLSVAQSSEYALVGAPWNEGQKGSAYIYDMSIFLLPPITPVLNDIDNSNNDGNYKVTWAVTGGIVDYYTLEEDDDPSFQNPEVVYTGKESFKSITGKNVGTYYYRVNATNNIGASDWSNISSVNVIIASPTCDICCGANSGGYWFNVTCESGSYTSTHDSYRYWDDSHGWVTGFQGTRTYDNTGHSYNYNGRSWLISSGGSIEGRIEVEVTGGIFGEIVQYCQNYGDFINLAADFESDTTSGTAPVTVHFTDKSKGYITNFLWDFGDGDSSTKQDPIHTYTDAGKYNVKLIVSGSCRSDTIERADFITVTDPTNITKHEINEHYEIYPNPAGSFCTIRLGDLRSSIVIFKVYNSNGELVMISYNELTPGNSQELDLDISELPTGLYYILMNTDSVNSAQKLLIIR